MKKILLREPYQSRYKRWEDKRIEQFGFVNNLLIALSSVLLFWMIQVILEEKLVLSQWVVWAVTTSGLCFFLSIAIGLLIAINRLRDFQKTSELIKKENEKVYYAETGDNEKIIQLKRAIERQKSINRSRGCWNWGLLFTQCLLFFSGFISLGLAVVIKFAYRSLAENPSLSNFIDLMLNPITMIFLSAILLVGLLVGIYQTAKRNGRNEITQSQVKPLEENLEKIRLAKSADEELIKVLKNRIAEFERYVRNKEL